MTEETTTTTAESRPDYEIAGLKLDSLIKANDLGARFEFVPFSQSRNAKPRKEMTREGEKPWRSLNWRVTFTRGGRDLFTTEYSAGLAHCPAYKKAQKSGAGRTDSMIADKVITAEIEGGFELRYAPDSAFHGFAVTIPNPDPNSPAGSKIKKAIVPALRDVWASVLNDSDVLDSGGFESWASDYGYDTDSRNAESVYKACLEIGLKVRAALGDSLMATMRELAHSL